jgi:hypothetical protein
VGVHEQYKARVEIVVLVVDVPGGGVPKGALSRSLGAGYGGAFLGAVVFVYGGAGPSFVTPPSILPSKIPLHRTLQGISVQPR